MRRMGRRVCGGSTHVVAVVVEIIDGCIGLLRRGGRGLRRRRRRASAHPVLARAVARHGRLLLPNVQRAGALAARHCMTGRALGAETAHGGADLGSDETWGG